MIVWAILVAYSRATTTHVCEYANAIAILQARRHITIYNVYWTPGEARLALDLFQAERTNESSEVEVQFVAALLRAKFVERHHALLAHIQRKVLEAFAFVFQIQRLVCVAHSAKHLVEWLVSNTEHLKWNFPRPLVQSCLFIPN